LGDRTLLRMQGIRKSFGPNAVLRDVDFDVRPGEIHALIGENGAGKSTLMNILCGAVAADAGSIQFDGRPIKARSPAEAIDCGVAMMHQEPKLAAPLSLAENIFMGRLPGARGGRLDRKTLMARTREVLAAVSLPLDPERPVGMLSIAQRQLIQLAKALACKARLIVLDEPTASLTPVEVDALFGLIGALRARGASFIYISHHLDEIFRIASRVSVLKDGAMVATLATTDADKPGLIAMMVGRELSSYYPARDRPPPGEVVLEASHLSGPGFADVSFHLRRGEILGLAGLVGAGRTELARALGGAAKVRSGDLRIAGRATRLRDPADGIKQGVAYLPEDRRDSVLKVLPVAQNISLAARRSIARGGVLSIERERAMARDFIGRLHIRAQGPDQRAGGLSGGNQQKCVLARWMAHSTDVLIVDEPTRGVDVGAKREIYALLHEMARNGRAILMISSELPEILGLSDRILVMSEGRLTGELDGPTATESAILSLAVPQSAPEILHA
jgi:ABC-type sugar transport system ATPase subunit